MMKHLEIKAEEIDTEEMVSNYGGKIGDFVVILPEGKCFVLAKVIFDTMFQTTPTYCQC